MTTPHETQPVELGEQAAADPDVALPPRIRPVLDLRTQHLPERYSQLGLRGQPGVVAYDLPYGWLLWVPTDVEAHYRDCGEVTAGEVLTVLRFARSHGCDFVLFDADGDLCEGLPAWDW